MPRTLTLGACVVGIAAASSAAPGAAASTSGVRVGSELLPRAAHVLGALPDATKLGVTVALAPRDPAALSAFAKAVSTPGSDEFRHYITPAQFARRFGPSQAHIAAVRASLRGHGLVPGPVSANGLALSVTARAGVLSDAFSISFSRVRTPAGRFAIASTKAPLFDRSVAPFVQGVVGLDTLSVPQPLALRAHLGGRAPLSAPHVATGGPQPCAAAAVAAPGQQAYTADQIASAYSFSSLYTGGDEGAGQTIAVYELEPNDPANIATYQGCYGTAASVSYVPIDGGAGTGAGSGEAALDIEDLIGLVPKANLIVYQGPNSNSGSPGAGPYDTYNAIISQDRAKVITTSWGQCEPLEGSPDANAESTLFEEAASQGQTIVSAAGDDGAEDCFAPGQNLATGAAVDDPSSQPYVTGVGGTSMNPVGPPPGEAVWNNGGGLASLLGTSAGAGGGGLSTLWKMPSYQSSAPSTLHVINGSSSGIPCGAPGAYCRETPDVAADADPFTGYLIYYEGAWTGIGGTSAAAPVWAALVALANASPACAGTTVGFANPALYRVAGSPDYANYLHDVTAGNNDFTGTNGGRYAAGLGYDMATGLGTPVAATLAVALCETVTVTNPGAQISMVGTKVKLPIRANDAASASLTYRATGLPAGLSIDRATGVVTGTPTRAGASTVVVRATDTGGRTSTTRFKWTIRLASVLSSSPPLARCVKHKGCSYVASRSQSVTTHQGQAAHGKLYLMSTKGGAIAGATIAITDGKHTVKVHTGRSGTASFVLPKGPNRSIRAVYAGGGNFGSASLTFQIRNHG